MDLSSIQNYEECNQLDLDDLHLYIAGSIEDSKKELDELI